MAYDSVLDREMFRPKSRGVVSLDDTNESEDLRSRREKAMAMIDAAKEKFDPKNFQTLTEQDRPGVFRPVAVNMPAQQPTADTAMRMQQMAAQGVRPVGMAEGGIAYHFYRGGDSRDGTLEPTIESPGTGTLDVSGPTVEMQTSPPPTDTAGGIYDIMGTYTGGIPEIGVREVPDMSGRGDRRKRPSSLPYASTRPRITESPPKKDEAKKKTVDDNEYPTGIESIKAERARQREENFNMALIRAGLGIAAGKSSNALANIGEGGIAGLEQFARAEKEDRAFAAEEKKYQEDRAARLQRAAESLQEKQLTRETRILDIKSDENSRIDDAVGRLRGEYSKAVGDEAAQNEIKDQIFRLEAQKLKNQRIIQSTLNKLGHEGESMYGSAATVGSIIMQNGVKYRVTGVDQNGRPTAAEPVD